MTDDPLPQSDQIEGAPHPRDTEHLFGQDAAETAFLDAYRGDRLHHAWLVAGPRGVGKATLAWRIARFLLATPRDDGGMFAPPPPESLDIPDDHPVARRLRAGSEAGLFSLKRAYDIEKRKFKAQITVEDVRKLKGFFALSVADGGRRVVLVDTVDDMNVAAANALLKVLEEPPPQTVMLLVSHRPSGLLPTIRSRCRTLRCAALEPDDLARALSATGAPTPDAAALSTLAGGSVGEAMALSALDGVGLYGDLLAVLASLPRLDRPAAIKLAETLAARGSEARFDLAMRLIDTMMNRISRAGLGLLDEEALPGELDILRRLAPDPGASLHWANIAADLGARLRHGRAVNLDPASLILDMVLTLNETAAKTAA